MRTFGISWRNEEMQRTPPASKDGNGDPLTTLYTRAFNPELGGNGEPAVAR